MKSVPPIKLRPKSWRLLLWPVLVAFVCSPCLPNQSRPPQINRDSSPQPEGAEHGFPTLRDLTGKKLVDGDFVQWLEGGRLHVRITYQFSSAHRIEEAGVFRRASPLVQERWSWRELKENSVTRHFEVDLITGRATAEKQENNQLKQWSKDLKIQPGQSFAGFGFTLAIKERRVPLLKARRSNCRQ